LPDWTAAGGALTGSASVDAALVLDALATATSQIATAPAIQPAGLACGLNRLMLTSLRLPAAPGAEKPLVARRGNARARKKAAK
jgi:hypothetical protein